jgi:lysophospholipase L1-like esterase
MHHKPTDPNRRGVIAPDDLLPITSKGPVATRLLAAIAVGTLGVVAACGSDDGDGANTTAEVTVAPRERSTTSAVAPSATTPATETPSPVGVIALGHSGLTGENSDPSRPFGVALENSWATGTNEDVNSVYQRLIAARPETEGHVANAATAGAAVSALAGQARRALELVPNPELVIVQTIDGDIRCDGRDAEHVRVFGAALDDALTIVAEAAPDAHLLLVGQLGRPRPEFIEELVAQEPSLQTDLTGTGVCDFYAPDGELNEANFAALTAIIDGYEAEQARVCATFENCTTDGGVRAAYLDTVDNFSSDLNHLNVRGHAVAAELIWPVVADHLGLE